MYGKHVGHKCELATNIATSTREELRSLSKKLGDHYDTIKKARRKVIDTKDSILNTQQYVRNRIVKHMGVLRACVSRRETMLKCDVDERTNRKTKPLDEQERYEQSCINGILLMLFSEVQKHNVYHSHGCGSSSYGQLAYHSGASCIVSLHSRNKALRP